MFLDKGLVLSEGRNSAERLANIELSLKHSKDAVALDVTDGHSWSILGINT